MTWTYSVSDLATSEKDQIRLELGDTDVNYQLLQDEEVLFAISVERNFWSAAARCAEMIERFFTRKADVRLGRAMQVQYVKMAEGYAAMACKLRQKSLGTVAPYVGGMTVSDKQIIGQDTSLVTPYFERDMMINPWTGGYTPDSIGPEPSGEDDAGFPFD